MRPNRLAFAAAVLWAAPALSDEPSTSVVALDACDPAKLAETVRSFRDELAKQKPATVMSEESLLRPFGGAARGSIEDAAQLLKKSQTQFLAGALGPAEGAAKRALNLSDSLPPSPQRWEVQREGLTLLALIEDRTGRTASAMSRMHRILSVDPSFQAVPETCPPPFIERIEAMKQELKSGPRAKLSVTTLPRGLPVFVGGIAAGPSPVYLDLPQGDYEVAVRWGSRRGLPRQVHLAADVSVLMDSAVEGAVYPDAGPCIETDGSHEQRIALLAQFGQELKAEVTVGLRQEEQKGGGQRLVVLLVDAEKGRALREASVNWDSAQPADAVARLASFAAGKTSLGIDVMLAKPDEAPPAREEPARITTPVGPPPPSPVSGSDLALRYASYIGAALATAGLGFGAYTWLEADHQESYIGNLVNPLTGVFPAGSESQYEAYAASENRYRSWAVGLFVGTGVVAVASFILYVKSGAWGSRPLISGEPRRSPDLVFHF